VKVGSEELWYIATQAPLERTVVDFWQMIWQHSVSVVAMLTGGISVDAQVRQVWLCSHVTQTLAGVYRFTG